MYKNKVDYKESVEKYQNYLDTLAVADTLSILVVLLAKNNWLIYEII